MLPMSVPELVGHFWVPSTPKDGSEKTVLKSFTWPFRIEVLSYIGGTNISESFLEKKFGNMGNPFCTGGI